MSYSWRGVMLAAAVAGFVGVCMSSSPALASSVYTVSGASDPASPSCSGTVCTSLRAAVIAANSNSGSTIQLGANTYGLSQGQLQSQADVTIVGIGPGATKIQQTTTGARVIFASSKTATVNISGVTITGGNLNGSDGASGGTAGGGAVGGGILNYGTMTLTNVVLSGNTATGGNGGFGPSGKGGKGGAADGSAIATGDGSVSFSSFNSVLTLVSTTVSGNVTTGGDGGSSATAQGGAGGAAVGAVWADPSSSLTLRRSNVSNNHVVGGSGGNAVMNFSATANSGGVAEGAISGDQPGPNVTITDSTISGNTTKAGSGGNGTDVANGGAGGTAYGGGILAASLSMAASTVSANVVQGGAGGPSDNNNPGAGGSAFGGGIAGVALASDKFVNVTISGNAATNGANGSGPGTAPQGGNAFGGGFSASGAVPGDTSVDALFGGSTIADNTANGNSGGGNIAAQGAASLTFAGTIVAGGGGTGLLLQGSRNCFLYPGTGASFNDGKHNLEDTTPSQCGFSADSADQIGANAQLLALAPNGGLTQTMALGPTSPALGNGDSCPDYTSYPYPQLSVDQRGLPRPAGACDIGAYQLQPPGGAGAPQITGTPAPGQQLACGQGSWSGDQPTFAYQWLRDGTPMIGETASVYRVTSADAGHQLACRVTASNVKGIASQTSAAVSVPSSGTGGGGSVPPIVTGVGENHKVWVKGNGLPHTSSTPRHPVGTIFSFTLNETATVRFSFLRATPGRKFGRRCVAVTNRNRQKRKCTRLLASGMLTLTGHAGPNRVTFQGRVSPTNKLKLGSYTVLITASNAAGQKTAPQTLRFTIVGR